MNAELVETPCLTPGTVKDSRAGFARAGRSHVSFGGSQAVSLPSGVQEPCHRETPSADRALLWFRPNGGREAEGHTLLLDVMGAQESYHPVEAQTSSVLFTDLNLVPDLPC